MNEWCVEHHGQSGLTEKVKKSTISLKNSENQVLEFVQKWTPKGKFFIMSTEFDKNISD